jgi:ABC-type transport system involved in multi-copper enzyme maturation permease subunit
LSLWPYVALVLLLAVLSRNGGLALVVGVIWLPLEQMLAVFVNTMSAYEQVAASNWRFFTAEGLVGQIYQWSPSFHGSNWTYAAEWRRAPAAAGLLLTTRPHSALFSGLVLAAYTLAALGLAIWITQRRDVTEGLPGRRNLWALVRRGAWPAKAGQLPAFSGRGPAVVRLARAHLFKMGRTALPKIGVGVSLLLPLLMWASARSMSALGYEDMLFSPNPAGGAPLGLAVSLLIVGPLATVVAALAVSNELSLGTRRAEWARGVPRSRTIVAQSLALVLTLATMFAVVMAISLLIGAAVADRWYLVEAVQTVVVAGLASAAYIGIVQLGGALSRSPLGAMVLGLTFLLVDWLAILGPTLMIEDPGIWLDVARYAIFANTFGLATGGQILGVGVDWPHFGPAAAILLLLAYAIAGHVLAVIVARRRDG